MNSSERNEQSGPSVSMPAMLAMLVGAGGLFVFYRFDFLFQDLGEWTRMGVLAGALISLLWGVSRSLVDLPARRAPRRFRFGRNRVSLPRPGQFYLVIMIVIFSGSLLGRSNMLMLVFSMMAGPFVVNGWITYSMLKRTHVGRSSPPRVMAGEPLTVELVLSNRKRLLSCWLMSARDRVENADERLDPEVLFTRVPAGERRSGQYQARLMRRGRYAFGPVQLTARFPLGIVERGVIFDLPGQILVYPRLGRLSSRWMRDHFLAADLVERRELSRGAFDDEFHRIREFRWGDNPRDIHWRTSARHNALMVREFRQSRDLNLVVLVDLWAPARRNQSVRERVELAASVAATVCISHMRQSRDSKLNVSIAGEKLVNWEGESRVSNADPLLDEFAVATATEKPDVKTMVKRAASRRMQGSRTILVTTRQQGSPERAELDRIVGDDSLSEPLGHVEIVEADFNRLASAFEFV